ncbi:hypothetical protein [Pseudoduganella sp. R-34]|uniref:hypothetical protein n=1 Tax=Pseudoduganella sp. R-34 TaxID=3404062 RepID=UPI003CF6A50D
MQAFKGFAALVSGVENFPDSGGLYTKPKIDRKTIMDAEFVVIPSMEMEECMDEEGGYIPEQLAGKGYVEWLEAPMVRAVVSNKLQHSPWHRRRRLSMPCSTILNTTPLRMRSCRVPRSRIFQTEGRKLAKTYHGFIALRNAVDGMPPAGDRLERDAKAPLHDIVEAVFHFEKYDTYKDSEY